MTLLIPHDHTLEGRKRRCSSGVLGTLVAELCVNSANFRNQSTRFCLAYQSTLGPNETCRAILRLSGKYNVLLREPGPLGLEISRAMSPTMFEDIGTLAIERESDRLAIAANCCGYPTRLTSRT